MQPKVVRLPQRGALLAVNPRSAHGGKAGLRPFVEALERANVAVEIVELGEAAALDALLLAKAREVDAIIIAGGDGTIRNAADALVRLNRPVGLLPL